MIDLYCERTAAGFWNEPLNALSNAAFLLAALHAWHLRSRRAGGDRAEAVVIVLGGLIGVGSFLFHTFANAWSEIADIVPIWSFVGAYVVLTIHRMTGERALKTLLYGVSGLGLALLVSRFTGSAPVSSSTEPVAMPLNGSLQYAPALLALLLFTSLAWWRKHAIRYSLSIASVLFIIALIFRSIDLVACLPSGGTGTHFLWHLLNGLLVWVLLRALVVTMPPQRRVRQRQQVDRA